MTDTSLKRIYVSRAFSAAKPSNFDIWRVAVRAPRPDIFACMAAGFARRRIGFAAATKGAHDALDNSVFETLAKEKLPVGA